MLGMLCFVETLRGMEYDSILRFCRNFNRFVNNLSHYTCISGGRSLTLKFSLVLVCQASTLHYRTPSTFSSTGPSLACQTQSGDLCAQIGLISYLQATKTINTIKFLIFLLSTTQDDKLYDLFVNLWRHVVVQTSQSFSLLI